MADDPLEGKNSPPNFSFCRFRRGLKSRSTGSSLDSSTPVGSQHTSKSPGSGLSVTKLPSRKMAVHPAFRKTSTALQNPSNNIRRFSFVAKRWPISSKVALCTPGGRTFQTPLISTNSGITTQHNNNLVFMECQARCRTAFMGRP